MMYGNLAGSYFLTGRFAEAERTLQAAAERKLEIPPRSRHPIQHRGAEG